MTDIPAHEFTLRMRAILRRFLREVLPPIRSRHRNMANEETYIHTTLNRIFLRHLGVRIPGEEMRSLLFRGGYLYFTRSTLWIPERRTFVIESSYPLRANRAYRYTDTPPKDERFHWSMDGGDVRLLRSITIPCPKNTSDQKRAAYLEMQERVERFMKKAKEEIRGF